MDAAKTRPVSFVAFLCEAFGLEFAFVRFTRTIGPVKDKRAVPDITVIPSFTVDGETEMTTIPVTIYCLSVGVVGGMVEIPVSKFDYDAIKVGDAVDIKYRESRFERGAFEGKLIKHPVFV